MQIHIWKLKKNFQFIFVDYNWINYYMLQKQ